MIQYALSIWLVGHVPADEEIRPVAEAGFTRAELPADWAPIVVAWEEERSTALCSGKLITLPLHDVEPDGKGHTPAPRSQERRTLSMTPLGRLVRRGSAGALQQQGHGLGLDMGGSFAHRRFLPLLRI